MDITGLFLQTMGITLMGIGVAVLVGMFLGYAVCVIMSSRDD